MSDSILSDTDKKTLLDIARKALKGYYLDKEDAVIDNSMLTENLKEKLGLFVSLYKNGELRGCLGKFQSETPLYESVKEMALSSALNDHRFNPVNKYELDDLRIEISVLTPLKKINSIDEIILGKHGIYIKNGFNSGTFLPQVADKTGWTLEEFLGHCSKDKAGIGWDGWKKASLYTYEAIVFKENQ